MKITDIKMHRVRLSTKKRWLEDYRPSYLFNWYTKEREWIFESLLIKIETDEGVAGIGEAVHFPGLFGDTAGGSEYAIGMLKLVLIGQNPLDIISINSLMDKSFPIANIPVKTGIDVALHDLVAKYLNIPVYELIGGKCRQEVEVVCNVPTADLMRMASDIKSLTKEGGLHYKIKMMGERNADWEVIKACLEVDNLDKKVTFAFDVNGGWSVYETKLIADQVTRHPNYSHNVIFEQPIAAYDLDGLAAARSSISIPILVDDSVLGPHEFASVIRSGAADMVTIKLSKAGGITKARQEIAMAEAFNIPYIIDELGETRVGLSAIAHLALSAAKPVYAGFGHYLLMQQDIVKKGGVVVQNGLGRVPETPGLGIEELADEIEL